MAETARKDCSLKNCFRCNAFRDELLRLCPQSEAIIPFSSGLPASLDLAAGGAVGLPTYVGFGGATNGTVTLGNTITIGTGGETVADYAFIVPKNGIIRSLYAQFTVIVAETLTVGTIVVNCRLYSAPIGDTTFTLISDANVNLAPAISNVAVGTVVSGNVKNLHTHINAGDQLLLVFSAQNTSTSSIVGTLEGFASAGVAIS